MPAPAWDRIAAPSDGSREITLTKMITDIPLPIPRWVMSSPSHMMKAVPAVSVNTMNTTRGAVKWGTMFGAPAALNCELWNKKTSPVDCSTASVTVM